MTTRSGLRTLVRNELNDSGGTALWSSTLLDGWLADAIRAYSERLPEETSTNLTSVAAQKAYALPSDFQEALRVEHPTNYFRVEARVVGGDSIGGLQDLVDFEASVQPSHGYTYEVYGGSIYLEPAPSASGETIVVRYLASYAEPAADGDTLTTPARDDELLVWFICGRAFDWISSDEAKRMRYERQRGASAHGQGDRYAERFAAALADRRRRLGGTRRLVARP